MPEKNPISTSSPPDQSAWAHRAYLLAPIFAVAALAAVWVDLPVARYCLETVTGIRGELQKIFTWSEVFAHGLGVALIGAMLFVLLPDRRRRLARVLACAYGAGIAADAIKLLVGRQRPNALDELPASVWETFVGWVPLATIDDPLRRAIQSFPSGHAATATGFALALAWLYPRGRWVFATLAILAALQRVDAAVHYLSDTLAGAAVACLIVGVCLDRRLIGRWFDRLENRSLQQEKVQHGDV